MPLPSPATKPLLLIFPHAQRLSYDRCLVIAKHLRSLFDIRFLHSDTNSHLVYRQGFDTFANASFSALLSNLSHKLEHTDDIEFQFLEQVEILETLQPALVIGDNIASLGMATEFTGIPYISIINGYQSPYYVNSQQLTFPNETHEPFHSLREKYGLQTKHMLQEELEGDLNWICDLPELFPQKELPFHYDLIGPLLELPQRPTAPSFDTLSPHKKTIFIDFTDLDEAGESAFINERLYQRYNVATEAHNGNNTFIKRMKPLHLVNLEQSLPKSDLLLCNTVRLLYKALHYGIPVLLFNARNHPKQLIKALEHWQIGAALEGGKTDTNNALLKFWLDQKHSDGHRSIQYKVKASVSTIEHKLIHSLTCHFPFLGKMAASRL